MISGFKTAAYYYRYARGLVSGYTKESGYVISSTANMGKTGMNLIFVEAGSEKPQNVNTIPSFVDAKKFLKKHFQIILLRL